MNYRKCKLGIEELEGEGVGMQTLPMFELEIPGVEVREAPQRGEVCREMTAFMRHRMDGRNVYKRGSGSLEAIYTKRDTPRDASSIRFPGQWPDLVPVPDVFHDGKRSLERVRGKVEECVSRKRRKVEIDNTPRYGGGGLMSGEDFVNMDLHPAAATMAVTLSNSSLASTTWKAYSSAWRTVERCRSEWKVNLSLPWKASSCINFVSWCRSRGLKANSCRQYLAGIKKIHLKEGHSLGWCEDAKVKMVLRGYDHLTEDCKRVRVAMDPRRLWFLKLEISKRTDSIRNKRMLWFTAVIMLKASLRASEVMSDKVGEAKFEKILQWKDVKRRVEVLEGERVESLILRIKAPKEQKNLETIKVQLWRSEDFVDPVYAFDRYLDAMKGDFSEEDPVARWEDGSMLTVGRFNQELRSMLGKHFKYEEGCISSHSFRAGLVSLMKEYGCSEQELKDQGRWSSAAFALYLKSGRSEMRKKQLSLSRRVEEMIGEKMMGN